jgi:hypothetical protein
MASAGPQFKTLRMGDGCNFPRKGNSVKLHYDLYVRILITSRAAKEPSSIVPERKEFLSNSSLGKVR